MKTKIFLAFLILLALPLISANTYGSNIYGCGLYGVGCVVSPITPSGGGVTPSGAPSIQFDIKILEFESPIKLGESFDFMYFVKGVGDINNDVTIDFWIEKNEIIITSGSDVIFMGSNEEKIESASLFMPSDVESGIYKFVIKVSYGGIQAEAHRTIELAVRDGEATIDSLFDMRFLLDEIILTSSDELSVIAIFENFGLGKTTVDLTFIILNELGNEVYREEDNITVETEEILRKSFKGLDLDFGKYTIILNTLYGIDVRDEFRQDFEIKEIAFAPPYFNWFWCLIIGIILSLLILIIILIMKLRKKKKLKKIIKKTGKPVGKKLGRKSNRNIHQKIKKEVGNI
jgi:hypothetical protein